MPAGKYKNKYSVESTRLAHWDYANDGMYFITICANNREWYFGDCVNGNMEYSNIGAMANVFWREIPKHFPSVDLDEYVIMPNHVHGIIVINKPAPANAAVNASADAPANATVNAFVETRHGASLPRGTRQFGPLQKKSLSLIINQYKGAVKNYCNKNNIDFMWQAGFYDHIIRDEKSLMNIREYIRNNPMKWDLDRNNEKNLYI